MNKTQKSIKLFGWQGGTVHQVNDEFTRVLSTLNSLPRSLKHVNILNVDDITFELIMHLYVKNV